MGMNEKIKRTFLLTNKKLQNWYSIYNVPHYMIVRFQDMIEIKENNLKTSKLEESYYITYKKGRYKGKMLLSYRKGGMSHEITIQLFTINNSKGREDDNYPSYYSKKIFENDNRKESQHTIEQYFINGVLGRKDRRLPSYIRTCFYRKRITKYKDFIKPHEDKKRFTRKDNDFYYNLTIKSYIYYEHGKRMTDREYRSMKNLEKRKVILNKLKNV